MHHLNCLQQTKKSIGIELRENIELFNVIKKKLKNLIPSHNLG